MSSNYRVAVWSDIKADVERRIRENELRLNSCRDPDTRAILRRISDDDLARLQDAHRWIRYHQD